MSQEYPFFIGGQKTTSDKKIEVFDKFIQEKIADVYLANAADIEKALSLAESSKNQLKQLRAFERRQILQKAIQLFQYRSDEMIKIVCQEAGKPIKDARGEFDRFIETLEICAEECMRINGEVLPLDRSAKSQQYTCMTKYEPVGVCGFISPFNFPLNLVAHKIGPAIAAGCPFVLKPSDLTPISALIIAEVLLEAGLPPESFSVFLCEVKDAAFFVDDFRIKLLSFTGSPQVGWYLQEKAKRKKVVLELGGNASCIVDEDAAIDDVVNRLLIGAFYQSGQTCISVQKVLVHQNIYADLKAKLLEKTKLLKSGDPHLEETFVGPLIRTSDAQRIMNWLEEARQKGAKLLCGGKLKGAVLEPTVLESVPDDIPLSSEEVFGPVVLLEVFSDFEDALEKVNQSRFGIHAGVFTHHMQKAFRAWDALEVGGVIINDIPSWRQDSIPYGGVKDSGMGREGIKYAMQDMLEIKTMVFRNTYSHKK